jgi:ATP-binding cassette subfamily B protein
MLEGSLRISSDRMRHAGIGTFLGKVNESEALEQASFATAFGLFEGFASLGMSGAVLSYGPAPAAHITLLVVWILAIILVGLYRLRATRRWSKARIEMSNDLVEKISGNRTRVIQQQPSHWHDGEDPALFEYYRYMRSLDAATTALRLLPRAWMLAGFLALFPVLLRQVDALQLTIGIAGLILAAQAMTKASMATLMMNRLTVAWREIGELYNAGYAPVLKFPEHVARPDGNQKGTVLDLSDVRVTYPRSGRAALQGCSGRIMDGDRILLQGPSGGGKSTLASVITGLRRVDGGVALLEGLDVHTLDADYWRKLVAGAPQFHENHVFNATLAFNVLLGREWPPTPTDMVEAREVLEDLGLGPLLKRMPLELGQMVGAQGWQLSHGERSRVFVARALLQRSRLVVLDESFGALDPHTLVQCMKTVLNRSRTLLVIAHP